MLANLNNKKILITAGNSQIGNDIVNYFLKKNYCVYETYRKKKNTIKSRRLKHVKYNFQNKFTLKKNFDLFVHCASITPYKDKISKKMLHLNTQGLIKILRSQSSFKKIVLLSTMNVYGDITAKVVNENTKKKKVNLYGISKIKMEKILKDYCKNNYTKYLVLRLPGVIGNFKSNNNFLNKLIKNLSENKTVSFNNPNNYYNNVVHTATISKIANEFMLKKNPIYLNKIFNLCSTNPIKLIEIVKMIKKKLKSESKLIISKSSVFFRISPKKCLKFGLKIISTKNSINKTLNTRYIKKTSY